MRAQEEPWLRRTWQEVCCLPWGLDLRVVPASWQEAVFRLALSAVEEEADQGRTSCASLGELGAPFRGAPSSENTIPPLSFSTKVNALSARCDFKTSQKEHRVSTNRILLALGFSGVVGTGHPALALISLSHLPGRGVLLHRNQPLGLVPCWTWRGGVLSTIVQ